jgi:DNA-binding GntR family transcriptional regulator
MHVSRWGELNREFHMVLYQHAGQPRSLAIVANLLQECDRHTRLQLALTDGMARAEAEHNELLRLCTDGKIGVACKLLKTHIDEAGKSLLRYIVEHQKPGEAVLLG